MICFSANLGFLFPDLPFPDRITAAAEAGFTAVEFHDQAQAHDLGLIAQLLQAGGLRLCSLNTHAGPGFGSAAIPGEGARFQAEFRAALFAAQKLGAGAIHVMAGVSQGPEALARYLKNLEFALSLTDRPLLLEPLSPVATPGYFLNSFDLFEEVKRALPDPRLRLMGDWYHAVQLCGAGGLARLQGLAAHLGHVQLARGSDRGDPSAAEAAGLLDLARGQGLAVGLEYRATRPPAQVLAALRGADLRGAADWPPRG